MTRIAIVTLALLLSAPATAQDEPSRRSRDPISDVELIRWASNEVREVPPDRARPPLPPDSYLGTGIDGPLALPRESERDAERLLAELGGGTLGMLLGGGIGTLIVWGAAQANADPYWMMAAVGSGAMLGAVGVTAGVVLAADANGGRGNAGDAFVGQLVGSMAALPLVSLGVANDLPVITLVAAGVLPLVGAILGYELSHAARQHAYLAPTRGGAVGGVAGELP